MMWFIIGALIIVSLAICEIIIELTSEDEDKYYVSNRNKFKRKYYR